ncbi:hypothetical protein ACFY36_35805 [Actinoplanes sp. NPDC000266]
MPFSAYGATTTVFPELRAVVRPELAALPDDELAEAVASETGADPIATEDFLSGLRSFGKAIVQRLPAIAAGAASGAAAGPAGAIVGGLLGGLSAQPGAGAGQQAPNGAAPPTAGAGMLGLLANPAVQQALVQLAQNRTGGQVKLPSGEDVPAVAFAELLREAADQVVAEQANGESELPEYLAEAEIRDHRTRQPFYGRSRVDPVLRAAVLVRALDPSGRPTQVTTVNQQPAYAPPPGYPAPSGYVAPPPAYGQPPPGYAAPPPAYGQPPPAYPAPEPGGDPFVSYAPPDLGGTAPTVYGIEQLWEFDQALDEILGPAPSP